MPPGTPFEIYSVAATQNALLRNVERVHVRRAKAMDHMTDEQTVVSNTCSYVKKICGRTHHLL